MTSSFGALNAAYTGLVAAQQGLNVVGENITNAATPGYSRQEITTSSVTPAVESTLTPSTQVGEGVTVNGITRVDSPLLDAQVRTTSAADGYATEQSAAMNSIESTLNEPTDNGLSTTLQSFWSAWQNLSTQPNTPAAAALVIQNGQQVVSQLAAGYDAAANQWANTRASMDQTAAAVNAAATQIATLNGQIQAAVAAGNNANALMDQENTLATTISNLSGASVRTKGNGTMDVLLGGNALVSGTTVHSISVTGSTAMTGATASPVSVVFTDNPSATTAVSSGVLGADLALLAPSNASGTGGAIAEAAASYNSIASTLASTVNAIHQTGATPSGTTGVDFFAQDPSQPAALGLSIIPTDASGIAAATPGSGAANGSVADQLAALTTSATGADAKWSKFVVAIGNSTSAATAYATTTGKAAATAVTNQQSESSVDTDQETTNMLTYQHAYESAARVMTTVDSMLDTLINKTGLVGIA